MALVEWGDLAAPIFGRDVLTLTLAPQDDDSRIITVGGNIDDERQRALDAWEGA